MRKRRTRLAWLGAFGLAWAGAARAAGPGNGAWFAPTLRYEGGSVEVAFGIDEAAPVTLAAFDAQGKVIATLLDAPQAAGYHHFSLFSNRMQGLAGGVLFRLRAGDAVIAELPSRAR